MPQGMILRRLDGTSTLASFFIPGLAATAPNRDHGYRKAVSHQGTPGGSAANCLGTLPVKLLRKATMSWICAGERS